MILRKTFRFEASHRLPHHPGKCQRLHGHSWVLELSVEGPVVQSTGMVLDFYEMGKAVESTIAELDHHHLGTWERLGAEEEYRTWGVSWLPIDFNSTSAGFTSSYAGSLKDSARHPAGSKRIASIDRIAGLLAACFGGRTGIPQQAGSLLQSSVTPSP